MKHAEELKKWLSDKNYLSSIALRQLFKRTWLQTKTLLVKFRIKPQNVIKMGQHSASFYKKDEAMRAIRFLNTNPQKYISIKQLSILWGIHPYAVNKKLRDCNIICKKGATIKENTCHQSVLTIRPSPEECLELQEFAISIQKNKNKSSATQKQNRETRAMLAKTSLDKSGEITVDELSELWGMTRGGARYALRNIEPIRIANNGDLIYEKKIASIRALAANKNQEKKEILKHECNENLVTIPRLMSAWNLSKSFVFRILNKHGVSEKFKIERMNGKVVLFYDKTECEKIMPIGKEM